LLCSGAPRRAFLPLCHSGYRVKTWQLRELLADARAQCEAQEAGGDEPFMTENVSVEALSGLISYFRELVEASLRGEPADRILVGNLHQSLTLTGWERTPPASLGDPAPGYTWVFVWERQAWEQVFVDECWP
jgi:hypothetical protein